MDPLSALSTLPESLTSFIGRHDELELARALLAEPHRRLLTLTGPGGIGKTRLAIEIARLLSPEFPDGVTFVSLAAVRQDSGVMPAIGGALGLRELERDTAADAVASALGQARRLLVVDNFEHVLNAAPGLTGLLVHCPHIKIVATSRNLLRVEGEHAIPVPSLGVPGSVGDVSAEELLQASAVQLFVERARAVDPVFAWSDSDAALLAGICTRLDGLPLALELAATKVRHLTLAEIRDRLDERLPLLVDGSRDHPSRLRTMRDAIAWSHDLLASEETQKLFRRLAVFHGGFALDAVAGLSTRLDTPATSRDALHEQLAQLIDASLLLRELDPVTGRARYRMLETIRDFAWDELASRDETGPIRTAHAAFFTEFTEQYEFADLMPSSANAIERLITEEGNRSAALRWLEAAPEPELFLRLVAAHGNIWSSTANYREAAFWYHRALDRADAPTSAHRAKIQVHLGMSLLLQGDLPGAVEQFTDGLAACRALCVPFHAALAQLGLATVAVLRGDGERSMALLLACRETADDIPDRRLSELMRGMVSLNLGVVSRAAGELALAAEQIADMLRRARAEDYLLGTLIALGDLGDLARDRGDWAGALSFYVEALQLGKEQPIKRVLIEIVESVAIVAFQTGQLERSVLLLGAADALRQRTGLRYIQPESSTSLAVATSGSRAALGETAFHAVWERGRGLHALAAIDAALEVRADAPVETPTRLTRRETEVVRLLARGRTDPEIADALFISVRTVENHVAHILAKFGVHTRTAASSAAIAAGIATAEAG